jgi:DNA-binding GntR family transcriptional regulator
VYADVYVCIQDFYTLQANKRAAMTIKETQMIRSREKTRPKWCNNKLKRGTLAGTTVVAAAVRKPSRSTDTLKGAVEFPDEAVNSSAGRGSRGVKAHQILREAIATGRLKPGARVLESELATLLEMSRTPVREAIATLEAEGLVSVDGARGRVVTKLDYQSMMELYAVREVLEATAAGLAARNASDMEILALRDMVELEEQMLHDGGKLAEHNRRFHEAIYYCSHNRYILRMLEYIQTGMLLLGQVARVGDERRETALREHRAIVAAIEERDPAAAETAVRHHVRQAQQARIKMLLQHG